MSPSLNVVKEKEKEEDIKKKGQNENEGDIEESQVSMVIDEMWIVIVSMKWRMRQILVIVKLKVIWKKIQCLANFLTFLETVFIVLTVLTMKMFDILL